MYWIFVSKSFFTAFFEYMLLFYIVEYLLVLDRVQGTKEKKKHFLISPLSAATKSAPLLVVEIVRLRDFKLPSLYFDSLIKGIV